MSVLEPEFGVWLAPAQIEALYDWVADDGDVVTVTDMRSGLAHANLPAELASELSNYRGAVLVEQETSDQVGRAAIIDRRGREFLLEQVKPNVKQGGDLVKLATAALREVAADYPENYSEVAEDQEPNEIAQQVEATDALHRALGAWDEFVQAIELAAGAYENGLREPTEEEERIAELKAEIAECHRLGRVPERQLCELADLQEDIEPEEEQ